MEVVCYLNDWWNVAYNESTKRKICISNVKFDRQRVYIQIGNECAEINAADLKKAVDNCINI